jgi:hypothetical protein
MVNGEPDCDISRLDAKGVEMLDQLGPDFADLTGSGVPRGRALIREDPLMGDGGVGSPELCNSPAIRL